MQSGGNMEGKEVRFGIAKLCSFRHRNNQMRPAEQSIPGTIRLHHLGGLVPAGKHNAQRDHLWPASVRECTES